MERQVTPSSPSVTNRALPAPGGPVCGQQSWTVSETLRIAVVLGSTRERRFCDNVAAWAVSRLNAEIGIDVDVVDPAQLNLPCRHEIDPAPALVALGQRLAAAEAFVIVTPEYNRSYTAALKFVIDSFHAEWQAKPVAFVSYGGLSGGLRAVEHLRGVLAELHAVTIRDMVSFANAWSALVPTESWTTLARPSAPLH